MKNTFPIFLTLISLQIVLFNSCCPDDKPVLPKWEKPVGRDTPTESFSTCLVNEEPWETCSKLGSEASSTTTTNFLISLSERCYNDDTPSTVIEFDLKFIPKDGDITNLGSYNSGSFYKPSIFDFAKEQKTFGDSSGYIKFYAGSIPETLSGKYSFTGYRDSLGHITITNGKFFNINIK